MRILIVCKANFELSLDNFQKNRAYIYDQMKSLEPHLDKIQVFFLEGKGPLGYLKGAFRLRKFLKKNQFDLIHAHYGYSGLIASCVSNVPTVVTYHGTDITEKFSNLISSISILLADWNIFVSSKLKERSFIKPKSRFSIIPCGVDLGIFFPIEKTEALSQIGWASSPKKILFSSYFNNPIKNYQLAKQALDLIKDDKITMIELKGKTRKEIALILNAADVLLLTSISEGSPQIIKEAMACNCPIVATDVGDIKQITAGTKNCFVTDFEANEISQRLDFILDRNERTDGRQKILDFDNKKIALQIVEIYKKILEK